MYSKFLFVGLGGSGGKTLRFLKREIVQWLESHGIDADVPKGWQFLHIDTPTVPDGDEINQLAGHLKPDEYLGLVKDGMTFQALQNILDGQTTLWPEMQTWRVEPSGLGVGIAMGAGQKRAVGQTVAIAYSSQIREKIQRSVARMKVGSTDVELGELYHKVTKKSPDAQTVTYAVVVSSLAGGTGAGLLNITCDILRSMDTPASDNIFAILYTPEVFRSLKGAAGGGIQANSLAAISELLNGQWWHGSSSAAPGLVPPIESAILNQAGLPEPMERSGPTYPFLVGLVGASGIDHGTPDHLFQLAGRSLLSWVCDEVIQSKFIAYTAGNWANSASSMPQGSILVDEGAPHEIGAPCFSALGFARLSVGTSYLETYATQRLARDCLNHLLNYHHKSPEAVAVKQQKGSSNPKVLVEAMAATHHPAFLRDTQLTEMGPEENEIVNALRPLEVENIQTRFLDRAAELSELDIQQKLGVEQWRSLIRDGIDAALVDFESEYQNQLETSTRLWIESMQTLLRKAVAKWTASHGWLVTAQLCKLTSTYLRENVRRDMLDNKLSQARSYLQWRHNYVDERLDSVRGKIDNTHVQLREALEAGVTAAYYAGEAQLIERVAMLVVEAASRALDPFTVALQAAYDQGTRDSRKVVTWVEWDNPAPSSAIKPPTGDFSLIDPDDYASIFDILTAKDTGTGESHIAPPRTLVREDIISGKFLEDITSGAESYVDTACVKVHSGWWPAGGAAIVGARSAARLSVDMATTLNDLKKRSTLWVHRHGSAWGSFLAQGLRSFVSESQDVYRDLQDRRSALLTQLSAALTAAAPLINIDTALMGLVHPHAPEHSKLHISQIPLAGHPIEPDLISRLQVHGLDHNDLQDMLTNDDRVRHIDITTSLSAPHSVLTIESLLRPIGEQWAKMSTSQDTKNFWLHRRAQPLQRFIPAPQSTISCMIRGWFTARLLGLLKVEAAAVIIADAEEVEKVLYFPRRFLSSPRSPHDTLAQVLESLALAYVEVSRAGKIEPLKPYIALRDLGRTSPGSEIYSYEKLSPALSAWIDTGELPGTIAKPFLAMNLQSTAGSNDTGSYGLYGNDSDDARRERVAHLKALLKKTITSYHKLHDEHLHKMKASRTTISKAPLWVGLWDPQMKQALEQLSDAASEYGETLTSSEWLM